MIKLKNDLLIEYLFIIYLLIRFIYLMIYLFDFAIMMNLEMMVERAT